MRARLLITVLLVLALSALIPGVVVAPASLPKPKLSDYIEVREIARERVHVSARRVQR